MTSMRLNLNPKLEVVSQWPQKKKIRVGFVNGQLVNNL